MLDLKTVGRGHAVQFYEGDAELAAAVVPYLAAGARRDEALVVIATGAHRRDFEGGLEAEGVDLLQADAAGTLVWLDADATLAAFRPAGELDRLGLVEVVGGVLRRAAQRASGVRVFGEMVGLLWRVGHVAEAIELERLWDELAAEPEFSLFCAYPAVCLGTPQLDAVDEICELHSVVAAPPGSPPRTASVRLPPENQACARARRFVRATLRRWGLTGIVVEDAILVSSELAANSIVHARSPFLLEIGLQASCVRISATDAACAPPSPWAIKPTHGLSAVDAISERWGVTGARDGKTVWATLPTDP
jgi:MEDS: MEthanogen/methylotroph, DcmR Sensory domain